MAKQVRLNNFSGEYGLTAVQEAVACPNHKQVLPWHPRHQLSDRRNKEGNAMDRSGVFSAWNLPFLRYVKPETKQF